MKRKTCVFSRQKKRLLLGLKSETHINANGRVKMEEKVEVKHVSEREIWVEKHRVYLGEDNILYLTPVGESDEKIAIAMKEAIFKLINMVEGKVNCCVDFNKVGKQSPESRKIGKEHSEHEKTGKMAIFGTHAVARVIASFIMGVSRKKNLRFFRTKEEALAWLKG
ncbi:MAG: STAS/SEC14 domain-containing protein [Candidatus Aminicenantes bacterium]|nr:STAS/SEC14 domain-containing protein [Candidatus Aminicenantes bacterium]MBL7083218.1 STAS/SEC14 domain-containing protein [Candidatus Aminicenantes bacterium]